MHLLLVSIFEQWENEVKWSSCWQSVLFVGDTEVVATPELNVDIHEIGSIITGFPQLKIQKPNYVKTVLLVRSSQIEIRLLS